MFKNLHKNKETKIINLNIIYIFLKIEIFYYNKWIELNKFCFYIFIGLKYFEIKNKKLNQNIMSLFEYNKDLFYFKLIVNSIKKLLQRIKYIFNIFFIYVLL